LNILGAEVADSQLRGAGFAFPLPTWAQGIARGTAVKLGIRPEDFVPDAASPTTAPITLVEPMGSSTILHSRPGEQLVAIETGKDTPLQVGEAVSLTVDPQHMHLFDCGTGESWAAAKGQ
jgi:ABC-type sugar transport system ATPase subunit